MCIYTYMYICICIHIYVHVYISVYTTYIYICIPVCVYSCLCIYICIDFVQMLLTGLITAVGVQPDSADGLPLEPSVQLAMDLFSNPAADVRDASIKLVASFLPEYIYIYIYLSLYISTPHG